MLFRHLGLFTSKQLLVLLQVSLDLSEFANKLIVHENFQVLLMIVRLVSSLELLLWLTGIYSLEDADPSKVLQCELKLANGLGTSEVLGLLSLLSPLYFLSHI